MIQPVKRKYDSSRRRAASDSTQRRIIEAATALFLRDGYGRSSIEAIADAADVSPATIYKLFGNKATIAKRVGDVVVAGDHDQVPLAERNWAQAALSDPDPVGALRIAVEGGTAVLARITPIIEMASAAAHLEPALGVFVEDGHGGRWHGMAGFVTSLHDRGALRPGLSINEATDIMWTIQSPATYAALVLSRRWSLDRYRAWVMDQLEHAMLTRESPTGTRPDPLTSSMPSPADNK